MPIGTTKHYMATGKPSRVISVRIDDELLDAVRARARAGGRSVSGEVVYIVRERVHAVPKAPARVRPITGWLGKRATLPTHAEFKKARGEVGEKLLLAIRAKARRK
jgi:hypothetical protein